MALSTTEILMSNKMKTPWGGRFKKSINPLVKKFNASLPFDHLLFEYDIKGSKVHAQMLARQGLITQQEAEQICNALDEILIEFKKTNHHWNAEHEDIHMLVESLLIEKTGDVGKKLHTGRSRNDQVALDLRLYARDAAQTIQKFLEDLIATCKVLADKHADNLMPGYTHLQQAQPIALGNYFCAYQAMFERDANRLHDWHKRMNFSPLGAGALAGSSLPLDQAWVADQLGFSGFIKNTLDAVSDRDFVIELCSLVSIIMMHLSRLSEDLIIWSTQEFNFVELDDAFATGSSLMPNKKNPDVLELIRGKSGRVFGNLMSILTVMKALPLAYNKDMQEDKECLFDTVKTVTICLEVIVPFLQSLTFNTTHMHKQATSGFLEATKILEQLVLAGVPFRDAHHQVGNWVRQALETDCSLAEVMKKC